MGTTTHSIEVNAPLQSVYDQWTQFEEFPRFMKDVVEVRQHGPDALAWKVLMAGKEKQWEARIIEQIPDTSIVWESVDGTSNRGAVTFEPLGIDATRLTLVMEYEPEGLLEKAGDLLGIPSGHVEESLKSFRELIESKGTATGGWRGRIENTDLEKSSVDKDMAPDPAMTSSDGLRASNEMETYRQSLPLTETGEHQEHKAGMVARASDKEGVGSALDGLQPEPKIDMPADLRGDTFFEADNEEIARRAYHLYLARGQVAGHETDDWIEAKRQLLEENR
jgi:hypothetical protein